MKVLIYQNRKIDPLVVDASTPEKELAAYLHIFKILDEVWDVYDDIPDTIKDKQRVMLNDAREGIAEAARSLIKSRRNGEYESVWEYKVVEP